MQGREAKGEREEEEFQAGKAWSEMWALTLAPFTRCPP